MSTAHAGPPADLLQHLEQHSGGWRARWRGHTLYSAFQPVLSITHQRIVGYEALLRATDSNGANVGPSTLFDLVPHTDTAPLDLLARCLHMANFVEQRIDTGWLFLNTLPRMVDGSYVNRDATEALCAHFGFPPGRVVIEVLEQRAGGEQPSFMEARPAQGSRPFLVALDDFGAGFSNFDRVWRYRPDIVKLDRSLVQRAAGPHTAASFITNLVSILHHAGTMVLAEGVETEHELMVLMQADVDLVQGFWFGLPDPSVQDASAGVPALVRTMWRRFASYVSETQQREQLDIGDLTRAMLDGAHVLASTGSVGQAAQALFRTTRSLRVFATDEHGEQYEPSVAAPHTHTPPRLAPLFPDVHCNWSRREYFLRAISAPGRVSVTGPHYSMTDGKLCYTAAIAIDTADGMKVLCADFPFGAGPATTPSA
ncbi:sensor domain-containing phosphodiesterase [Paraburkholderia caballeronis]|uniref:sensor domain-containing phosphodiesterase n=1 Tax=Paraburkholderia caballeronis TaxID=416943 RepID=UPI001066655F|nr:EAL domain-containing protein [Paraburkholderia caballeronis]TDV11606.1 diguanylate phosphodiesterase [Paraburkholderia caballeronis]TDV17387.1 diguanylate phosphodiesterase [Paraburkholderia caballeronis]TDV27405.1 diguanylate phosphodiesterase [Paraburkholderia caballeronis]